MDPLWGVIPVAWLLSRYVCPHQQGGLGGASCMYNTPQNLLTEIKDKVRTLSEASNGLVPTKYFDT